MIPILIIGSSTPLQKTYPHFLESKELSVEAVFLDLNVDSEVLKKSAHDKIDTFSMDELSSNEGIKRVEKLEPDWIFNINSTVILNKRILHAARKGVLNLHPGLLPRYAGLHTHQWAIRNCESEFGATIHWVTEGIDEGDIVLQETFKLTGKETGLSLFLKTMQVGTNCLKQVIDMITANEKLPRIEQDLSARTLYTNAAAQDGLINWNLSARELEAFVRAADYHPFKSPTYRPYTVIKKEKVFIDKVNVDFSRAEVKPGKIVVDRNDQVWIGTGSEVLQIIKSKDKSQKPFNFKPFHGLQIGLDV